MITSKKTYSLLFIVLVSAVALNYSTEIVEFIRPGEITKLTSETYQIENEIWVNGDDLRSGGTIIYGAPLKVTVYDPNGNVYSVYNTRSKDEEERRSIACAVACGAAFDHMILDVSGDLPSGEWTVNVRFDGDSVYRAAEVTNKFQVG